jgi:hypothetical protein
MVGGKKMENKKVNQISVSEGVNSLNASSPQFSLSEREDDFEWKHIGLWAIRGVGSTRYVQQGFPKEYHKELSELDEKYNKKIEWVRKHIKSHSRVEEIENKRWIAISELQKKYLKREGFHLLGE